MNWLVIMYPLKRIQIGLIFVIYLFTPWNALIAFESKDYMTFDLLVKRCYNDIELCNISLSKIHHYQKIAAKNKKYSCQTRLLGLEANLIMAMNSNLKRNEAKSMIQDVSKYC